MDEAHARCQAEFGVDVGEMVAGPHELVHGERESFIGGTGGSVAGWGLVAQGYVPRRAV